ncbi:uncharacterized protein TNCT_217801, partial [Trichonephila clavata]
PGFRSFHMLLKPTYPCDEWNLKRRTCYVNRNIGDTVTFVLTKGESKQRIPHINWKQEFHVLGQSQRRHLNLSAGASGNPTWNIVIGNRGQELRLSPITEMDVDPNSFSATLVNVDENIARTHYARISFRVRPIPIDMGFVYPGETLILNIESYITLPPESLRYVWYMEKDREIGTMPSNMKTSLSGTTLQISELRKEQEGIMACAIYTNLDILIAKKRFLIKEIIPNDLLMHSNADVAIRKRHIKIPRDHIIKRKSRKIKVEEQLDENFKSRTDNTEGIEVDSLGEKESLPINIIFSPGNKRPMTKDLAASFFKTNANPFLLDTSFQNEENNKNDPNIDIDDLESFKNQEISSPIKSNTESFGESSFQNQEDFKTIPNRYIDDLKESFENRKLISPERNRVNPSSFGSMSENQESFGKDSNVNIEESFDDRAFDSSMGKSAISPNFYKNPTQLPNPPPPSNSFARIDPSFPQRNSDINSESNQPIGFKNFGDNQPVGFKNLGDNQPVGFRNFGDNQVGQLMNNWDNQPQNFMYQAVSQSKNLMNQGDSQSKRSMVEEDYQPNNFMHQGNNRLVNFMDQGNNQPMNYLNQGENQPNNYMNQFDNQPSNYMNQIDNQPNNYMKHVDNQPSNHMNQVDNQPSNFVNQKESQPSSFVNQEYDREKEAVKKPVSDNFRQPSVVTGQNVSSQLLDPITQATTQTTFKGNGNTVPSERDSGHENDEPRSEDAIAKVISICQYDKQCSGHASCIRILNRPYGFCRCLPGYHGNGISCWEDILTGFSQIKPDEKTVCVNLLAEDVSMESDSLEK